jgi:hypothetical protein
MIGRQTSIEPPLALLAAQERLKELREQTRAEHDALSELGVTSNRSALVVKPAAPRLTAAELGQLLLVERRRREAINQGHRASDVLQAYLKPESSKSKWPLPPGSKAEVWSENGEQNIRRSSSPQEESVKIYPSLALAMLHAELAAPGRVYWLLKHLDTQGRGWLSIDEVRFRLTNKKSNLRVCGWRRLRQIFAEGEDLFWTRDRVGRLWIKGPARVAQALGCGQLRGKPIALETKALLGGIKQVRAHFYASFHSSRREANPVTRGTLRGLTGVPERTQRQYEQVADVASKRNIAIGEQYSKEAIEERAWRQGQAAFRYLDTHGKQGAPGREYVAWHMPNSYEGPHSKRCKGRQKKINRQLRALVMKGMLANGRKTVERLFWANGAAAAGAYNRDPGFDAYWPRGRGRASQYILWSVVPGKGR